MREKMSTKEGIAKKRPFLMDIVTLMIFFFLGCITYYIEYHFGLCTLSQECIVEYLQFLYEKIGIVTIGLIPLTLLLLSLTVLIFLETVNVFSFHNSPLKKLFYNRLADFFPHRQL